MVALHSWIGGKVANEANSGTEQPQVKTFTCDCLRLPLKVAENQLKRVLDTQILYVTFESTFVDRNVKGTKKGRKGDGMTGKYISYLRVSTQRQGVSGLGLEAQRSAVENYLSGGKWTLVQEVVEVESGKRNDRPELAKALALCRIHRAKLLVAKLDRLARNVAFISTLMESGVKFVAVDMPDVNEMVVHILASVAQGEAKAISERTRLALAAAKARGKQLGGVRTVKATGKVWDLASVAHQGRSESLKVRRQHRDRFIADIVPMIEEKQRQGATSLCLIADALNAEGAPAPRGGMWTATQVQRVMARAAQEGGAA